MKILITGIVSPRAVELAQLFRGAGHDVIGIGRNLQGRVPASAGVELIASVIGVDDVAVADQPAAVTGANPLTLVMEGAFDFARSWSYSSLFGFRRNLATNDCLYARTNTMC